MKYQIEIGGTRYELVVNQGKNGLELLHDEKPVAYDLHEIHPAGLYSLLLEGRHYRLWLDKKDDDRYRIKINTCDLEAEVSDQGRLLRKALNPDDAEDGGIMVVRAPIPGLVLNVEVSEGQEVAAGDGLVIMEAMKMENEIKAPGPGSVQKIYAGPGDTIEKDSVLLEIERHRSEE